MTSLIRGSTFAGLVFAAACTSSHNDPTPTCGTPGIQDQIAQTQNEVLSLTLAGDAVYWLDLGGVGTAPVDGSTAGTEVVTGGAIFALGGTITTDGTNVYWADGNYPAGSVDRIAMAGGNSTQITVANEPTGVAVDAHNIYWSTFGSSANPVGTIVKQPLDGGAAVTLATGLSTVGPIALDESNVYWNDMFGSVSSVPIAGGAVHAIVPAQYALPPNTILDDAPVGIAVSDGEIFWTSTPLAGSTPNVINSISVDGGAITTVVTPATQLRGLAVDGEFVYWAELGEVTAGGGLGTPPIANQGTINRIARDGSTETQQLATGATYPVGPAVGENVLYYSTGGSASTIYRVVM